MGGLIFQNSTSCLDNAALYNHLTAVSRDMSRNASERYMYDGLETELSSAAFVPNLGLKLDALEWGSRGVMVRELNL